MGPISDRPTSSRATLAWPTAGFVLAISLRQISDPDYWTHLALGRAFVAAGSIRIEEPFLLAVRGAVDPVSWPAQILFHAVRAALGDAGVSALVAVVAAAAFLPLALLLPAGASAQQRGAAFVLLAAAAAVARFRFAPRPEVFAYPLLALTLSQALAFGRAPSFRKLLFVGLALAAWIPCHVSWALGAALAGAALLLRPRPDFWREAWSRRRLVPLAAVALALAFAGASAARFGAEVLGYLRQGGLLVGVTEMRPTWEFPEVLWPFLAVAALALVLSLGAPEGRWRRAALWLVALALGLAVVRNVAFALLAMAAAALPGLAAGRGDVVPGLGPRAARAAAAAIALALLGLALRDVDPPWGVGVRWALVPREAARFVAERSPPGPVFNSWDLGGYLDWAWGGRPRTFLDGRLVSTALVAEHDAVVDLLGPEPVLARYGFGTVLLQALYRDSGRILPAVGFFLEHPGWRLVHASDALVFARLPLPPGLEPLRAAEAWREVLREVEGLRGARPEPPHLLYARTVALDRLGERLAAAASLREAMAAHPELAAYYRR